MAAHVLLLRGINIGSRNRIAMPELRAALAGAGFGEVRTYLQSGNVVVSSRRGAERLVRDCRRTIADRFGLDVQVIGRSRDELAEVVGLDPLGAVASSPKRYQVSFLDREPDRDTVDRLSKLAAEPERFVHVGRELYAWHPEGVARSRLWNALAGSGLGFAATARNWTTVTSLLAMADE